MHADAVVATGPTAYAVAQLAIGALQFGNVLTGTPEASMAGDPASCLPAEFRQRTITSHVRRQLRCALPARADQASSDFNTRSQAQRATLAPCCTA